MPVHYGIYCPFPWKFFRENMGFVENFAHVKSTFDPYRKHRQNTTPALCVACQYSISCGTQMYLHDTAIPAIRCIHMVAFHGQAGICTANMDGICTANMEGICTANMEGICTANYFHWSQN
jgi:hypothetical protein